MPEQKKKNSSSLTLKESHLETLRDVIASSVRIANLRRDTGVLGWKLRTLEGSLTKSEPFSMSISAKKRIESLHRHLTTLEKSLARTVTIVDRLEKQILRLVLTAENPSLNELDDIENL